MGRNLEVWNTELQVDTVEVGNTSTIFLEADNQRVAVFLNSTGNANITYSFESPAELYEGMTIPSKEQSMILSLWLHGKAVQSPIYAIASNAGPHTVRRAVVKKVPLTP